MAFTKSEIAATFALQMAEQTRRLGQALKRLRLRAGFTHQKDLVARMHELGDHGLNTNQVSRYENGEGPMPRERRVELFAEALGVDVADLLADRASHGPTPDLFAAEVQDVDLAEIRDEIRDLVERFENAVAAAQEIKIFDAEQLDDIERLSERLSRARPTEEAPDEGPPVETEEAEEIVDEAQDVQDEPPEASEAAG